MKVEWKTLGLLVACYAIWVMAGLAWQSPFWWIGLPVMVLAATLHSSLQHEAIHGHPTPYDRLNEALVSLPLSGIFPFRRYRELHLLHHNDLHLTDPYEDPESYFWPHSEYRRMRRFKRRLFAANNTLVGRLTIGPALTMIGFVKTEFYRLVMRQPGVGTAWLLHLLGLTALGWIVTRIFGMPLWVYILAVSYPSLSLTSLRSYAEHQAAENVGHRSAIVEACGFFSLLYLNNNLHIVHHASPATPWYDLPKLYRQRRQQFLSANGNYLFLGYIDIARRFAFSIKQPVDHPFLHRELEPPRRSQSR